MMMTSSLSSSCISSSSSSSSSSSYMKNNNNNICCKFSPIISLSRRLISSGSSYSWISPNKDFVVVVCSAVDPAGAGAGAGAGPPPPHSNWKSWILGMAVTLILPFLRHKLGPLLLLTNRVEKVVEKAEGVAEMIEKTAETVGKMAEEISDELPEGGKLRDAVEFIESLAKETAKDAHLAGDLIDQVQDVEDVVENIIIHEKDDIAKENNNTTI